MKSFTMKTSKHKHCQRYFVYFSIACLIVGCAVHVRAKEKIYIRKVDVSSDNKSTTVTFNFSDDVKPSSVLSLNEPERIIIELENKDVYYDEQILNAEQGLVNIIRFALKESNLRTKEVEYIAIELTQPFTYKSSTRSDTWRFIFKSRLTELDFHPVKTITGTLNLQKAISVGRANSIEAQLAKERVELAEMRENEALRALFPAMTAKYEQTRGETRGAEGESDTLFGFREKFLTMQLSQPLYQGGKLKATYEQAKLNREINQLKYDQIINDLDFDIRKAYMDVVQQQKNTKLYDALLDEVKKDYDIAKRIRDQKLITYAEYLNVKSKYQQVLYQLASLRQDLQIAKSRLLQVLNLDEHTLDDITVIEDYAKIDIELDKLLTQMRNNLQSLRISELEMKLAEQGKIIGHSEKNFKLEVSGSLGRSKSYYDTETGEWKNDYSGGIKLSKPFGGNTVGSSYLYDDTSAKLGQTNRTLSKTGSVSLGILDNMKSMSDAKESDIELRASSQKLIEARRTAQIELKESYYNYQKSLIQVDGLEEEVRLNQEELRITKQKRDLNYAQLSEHVDAKLKLAGTRSSLNEAITFYYTALAGINKSIGLPNFYKPKRSAP
ncbi:MAG: hypothetical protein GF384_03715 [Elusimicrobia bacterium]|nr:hypothetical protein [Elusimicrobiota bacterium]MBD3412018.1 hypothetical protein [Elusimicrobiota bacterium]